MLAEQTAALEAAIARVGDMQLEAITKNLEARAAPLERQLEKHIQRFEALENDISTRFGAIEERTLRVLDVLERHFGAAPDLKMPRLSAPTRRQAAAEVFDGGDTSVRSGPLGNFCNVACAMDDPGRPEVIMSTRPLHNGHGPPPPNDMR